MIGIAGSSGSDFLTTATLLSFVGLLAMSIAGAPRVARYYLAVWDWHKHERTTGHDVVVVAGHKGWQCSHLGCGQVWWS